MPAPNTTAIQLRACARKFAHLDPVMSEAKMMPNRNQWLVSFRAHLAILRPHMTHSLLASVSSLAWQKYGLQNEDPLWAAKEWSQWLDSAAR